MFEGLFNRPVLTDVSHDFDNLWRVMAECGVTRITCTYKKLSYRPALRIIIEGSPYNWYSAVLDAIIGQDNAGLFCDQLSDAFVEAKTIIPRKPFHDEMNAHPTGPMTRGGKTYKQRAIQAKLFVERFNTVAAQPR